MNWYVYILVSMVVFQAAISYYVYKKLFLLKTFKPFGVGISQLYIGGLILSPLLFPLLVFSLCFEVVKSFFVKKKATPSVDDLLKDLVEGK